jgi:hypothetical protein
MSVASIFTIQTDRLLRGRAARLVSRVGLSPGSDGWRRDGFGKSRLA